MASPTLADSDWLLDYSDEESPEWRYQLHAPAPAASAHFRDAWGGDDWSGEALCGVRSEWWGIPGILSRMTKDRCPACCGFLGYPVGVGSPKNDPECRRILGLEVPGE